MLFSTTDAPLMAQLCQPEILSAAWRKVRANKGGPGSDGVTIGQFEIELNKHLRQLARELAEARYYPLPIRKFTVKKTSGGTRELSILTLKDRIVQRAVCDLIEPIYEAKFLDSSFGFRPNRGVPHAIARVVALRAEGYEWVVDADIEKFFDTMDVRILMRFLRATLREPPILRLIQMWLDMGAITQPPSPSAWFAHLENTAQYVGESVERVINHLLHRGHSLGSYNEIGFPAPIPPTAVDWMAEESPLDASASPIDNESGLLSQAKGEALRNLGRDGLMLLLANSKGLWRRLSTKQLLLAAPILMATLATPTVSGVVKDHLSRPRKIGTLQGSPLSPLLANIYLHPFDKAMTRAGLRLVRYADDLLILCRNESRAQHALGHAQKRLAMLKLKFNPQKTRIASFNDGVEFLGHIFDVDGCYQPVDDSRAKVVRHQMQHALKKGTAHLSQSGRQVAKRGKNIAAQITQTVKRRCQSHQTSDEHENE